MKYKVLKQKNENCAVSAIQHYDVKETYRSHGKILKGLILFTGSLPECYAWIKLKENGYID